MKVVADFEVCIPEEIKESMKSEKFVYYSEEHDMFLMSDETYNKMLEKYEFNKINTEDEDLDITLFNSMEDFLRCHYEQESEEFLGTSYDYPDFIEEVLLTLFDLENKETGELYFVKTDWMNDIKKYMKIAMSTYIMGEIRDELNEFKEEGFEFDYNILG